MSKSQMTPAPVLVFNAMIDELEERYDEQFKAEYGIVDMVSLGEYQPGYEEVEIEFKDERFRQKYAEDFDIEIPEEQYNLSHGWFTGRGEWTEPSR